MRSLKKIVSSFLNKNKSIVSCSSSIVNCVGGENVVICGNTMYVDGKVVARSATGFNITLNGSVNTLDVDAGNVTVNNDVKGDLVVDKGNVKIKGDVHGNVRIQKGNLSM